MKQCIPCETICDDEAVTCAACGEASWQTETKSADPIEKPVANSEVATDAASISARVDEHMMKQRYWVDRPEEDDAEDAQHKEVSPPVEPTAPAESPPAPAKQHQKHQRHR